MKYLSLVFFVYFENNKNYILMGTQAPQKRLAGIRNGFGGKCNDGESTLDCAIRETEEEVGILLEPQELKFVGKIINQDMTVDVFVKISDKKFTPPADNDEFVDIQWFDLNEPKVFVSEMLPNSHVLLEKLSSTIKELQIHGEPLNHFTLDVHKTNNPELELLRNAIYK